MQSLLPLLGVEPPRALALLAFAKQRALGRTYHSTAALSAYPPYDHVSARVHRRIETTSGKSNNTLIWDLFHHGHNFSTYQEALHTIEEFAKLWQPGSIEPKWIQISLAVSLPLSLSLSLSLIYP